MTSRENIRFPVIKDGEILGRDEMLKIVLEKANKNVEKCWEKTDRIKKLFE